MLQQPGLKVPAVAFKFDMFYVKTVIGAHLISYDRIY
jgi:hypothetical protein